MIAIATTIGSEVALSNRGTTMLVGSSRIVVACEGGISSGVVVDVGGGGVSAGVGVVLAVVSREVDSKM